MQAHPIHSLTKNAYDEDNRSVKRIREKSKQAQLHIDLAEIQAAFRNLVRALSAYSVVDERCRVRRASERLREAREAGEFRE